MSNDKNNLTDLYSYHKRAISDKKKLEIMLIKDIQQICYKMGYKLVEIKLENNDTLQNTTDFRNN